MGDKYTGCLMGLAIGDALGTPFEFWNKMQISEHLSNSSLCMRDYERGGRNFPKGFYSDDSSQMICLAESLTEKGFDLDDQYNRYRKWLLHGYATPMGDKSYGAGQHTLKVLMKESRQKDDLDGQDKFAGGNGALMRCAPIGLYYQGNLDEIKEKSLLSAYVTHNSSLSGWCCVIVNCAISLIIDGNSKEHILNIIKNHFNNELPKNLYYSLSEDYQNMPDFPFKISGYSFDTLQIALWSWIRAQSFEESLNNAIRLGNDVDTFAAITGALAGCYWGYESIPDQWKDNLLRADYIKDLAVALEKKL